MYKTKCNSKMHVNKIYKTAEIFGYAVRELRIGPTSIKFFNVVYIYCVLYVLVNGFIITWILPQIFMFTITQQAKMTIPPIHSLYPNSSPPTG